jgi:hypothetical protein
MQVKSCEINWTIWRVAELIWRIKFMEIGCHGIRKWKKVGSQWCNGIHFLLVPLSLALTLSLTASLFSDNWLDKHVFLVKERDVAYTYKKDKVTMWQAYIPTFSFINVTDVEMKVADLKVSKNVRSFIRYFSSLWMKIWLLAVVPSYRRVLAEYALQNLMLLQSYLDVLWELFPTAQASSTE